MQIRDLSSLKAFWDKCCRLPFPALYSQRMQAQRARTRLLAREAGDEQDLTKLTDVLADLPTGEKGFLAQTERLQEMVTRIHRQQLRVNQADRAIFRKTEASDLVREIEAFRGQVGGFKEPLASEFRKAAEPWLANARKQLEEVEVIVSAEPVGQVFRAGDPVNPGTEAFLPRIKVLGRLEQQVMLSTGRPGVILYGRRRRGKSTVLKNLTRGGILPESVRSASFSMEEPAAFASLESWCGRVARSILEANLEGGITSPAASEVDSLETLFRFVGQWSANLANANLRRLLVAIDEYEYIDRKIGEGVFPVELLATIRESIQSHRNITWVFAGSHEIEELPNAEWPSYLVSARTIEVPNFTLDETRLLLTEPLRYSPAYGKDSPDRPSFDPSFWGVGGIERIYSETDGWPHLVQLIAETCVDLVNEEERREVSSELFERALDESVDRGRTVLSQLMRGESALPGEWEYLLGFKKADEQAPPEDEAVRRSLQHREIVREEGGLWRLSVPLMGRWLRRRG